MEEEIENLGKGALVDTPDHRDYTAELVLGASEPIDWSRELILPEAVNFNQGSSNSCVGCGGRSLHWQINPSEDWSRRDLYSQIYIPPAGGAYLRDVVKLICDIGNRNQKECPDPSKATESNMREKATSPNIGDDGRELGYFVIKNNIIDTVAQAVRDYNGAIIGVVGSNEGWRDKTNPRPPKQGEAVWQHCIHVFGYKLINNKKTLICKSSWCSGSHHIHYINEDYFASGNTFNGWCLIPKEETSMTNSILVKRQVGDTWEYGFFDPDTAPDALISDMRNRGVTPPLKEDGTLDWDRVENMISGLIVSNK